MGDDFISFINQPGAMGFLAGLKVWTDKGYTAEEAIERHLATLTTLLDRCTAGRSPSSRYHDATKAMQRLAADTVWDAVNAQQVAA